MGLALLYDAADRAGHYAAQLDGRAVFPSEAAVEALSAFDEAMPSDPATAASVLEMLDDFGSPATVAMAGRRYFGFVTGGSLPAALAANWLAGAWDQNAGLVVCSPTAAKLEAVAAAWLVDLMNLPAGTQVGFVTGATMANFSALAAARHSVLAQTGWNVEEDGLFGAPPITVYIGDEAHVSLLKALGMLGLGRKRVVRVPVDRQGRMRADVFPEIQGPAIVCLQAGNVNTGAFDPAAEICAVAHQAGAWVHVDAAFGLWAAAAPSRAHLMDGANQADSWATDGHKWLNVPYDCGLVFVRNGIAMKAAMSTAQAAYLVEGGAREPSHYTPELSRRARGVEVWAALKSLGKNGLAEMIETTCAHARRFAEVLSAAGYRVGNEVFLNQVLVSFGSDETTGRVISAIQSGGVCWCGPTEWQGRAYMRISVSSWATTAADVEICLDAILSAAQKPV
ncbi:MAG: aminotransferase class V-fold PLP-dependent enzyme [Bryobacteraceae bacterium]